jgi:hypothetical protein
MEKYSVIGKRIPRVDGRMMVTGEAKYAADYVMPGMLWCKILRSPHPHAKILTIDTGTNIPLPSTRSDTWERPWQPSRRLMRMSPRRQRSL